jgi:hypothetical protein
MSESRFYEDIAWDYYLGYMNKEEVMEAERNYLERTELANDEFVRNIRQLQARRGWLRDYLLTEGKNAPPPADSDCEGSFMPYDDQGRYWD